MDTDKSARKPYPHKGFAERLNKAMDANPNIPPKYQGRQVWLAKQMDVSQEAARKWLAGITIPRMNKIHRIASLLGIDAGWLSVGKEPLVPVGERKEVSARAGAADYMVFAAYMSYGWACAFNDGPEEDGSGFTAIKAGRREDVFVSPGIEVEDNKFRFELPSDYAGMVCLGVNIRKFAVADVIALEADKVKAVAETEHGRAVVYIEKSGRQYQTGKLVWDLVERV